MHSARAVALTGVLAPHSVGVFMVPPLPMPPVSVPPVASEPATAAEPATAPEPPTVPEPAIDPLPALAGASPLLEPQARTFAQKKKRLSVRSGRCDDIDSNLFTKQMFPAALSGSGR